MKKLKKFIIALIIIIVVLIITILILLLSNEGGVTVIDENDELIGYDSTKINKVMTNTDFYTVTNCIQEYLNLLEQRNKYISDEEMLQDFNKSVYNILSVDYINTNKIQENAVDKYIDNITEKVIFVPLDMYIYKQNDNIGTFITYGLIEDINNKYKQDLYIIVNLDMKNSTFSVEPILNNEKDIEEINIAKIQQTEIEENENNVYETQKIDAEYISSQYLDRYKKITLAAPDIAYEYLEQEYRSKKFNNIDEFKQYILDNRNDISTARLVKYSVSIYENYMEYTCVDQNDNYYIFRQDNMMDYTVILDNYTVDIPRLTEQYNNADKKEKCMLNIEKIKEALNDRDYKYVYGKLADSFKANNFTSQANFEQYINRTLYKKIDIEYEDIEIQNNNYVFKVLISNLDNPSDAKIEKTIVVQLTEKTDFVFSFSI